MSVLWRVSLAGPFTAGNCSHSAEVQQVAIENLLGVAACRDVGVHLNRWPLLNPDSLLTEKSLFFKMIGGIYVFLDPQNNVAAPLPRKSLKSIR